MSEKGVKVLTRPWEWSVQLKHRESIISKRYQTTKIWSISHRSYYNAAFFVMFEAISFIIQLVCLLHIKKNFSREKNVP